MQAFLPCCGIATEECCHSFRLTVQKVSLLSTVSSFHHCLTTRWRWTVYLGSVARQLAQNKGFRNQSWLADCNRSFWWGRPEAFPMWDIKRMLWKRTCRFLTVAPWHLPGHLEACCILQHPITLYRHWKAESDWPVFVLPCNGLVRLLVRLKQSAFPDGKEHKESN